MQRDINYRYKSFDFCNSIGMDKIRYGLFNEYGYNLDASSKRILDNEKNTTRSMNNNTKNHGLKKKSK
ncbi:MAG: hypothetical protein IJ574_05410 [Bacilli bacterium]|nr:hypothetical protein [Bacilli bacterium]